MGMWEGPHCLMGGSASGRAGTCRALRRGGWWTPAMLHPSSVGMHSPTMVRWGRRHPRVMQGAGEHHPCVPVAVAGCGQLRGAMPRRADGAMGGRVARGRPRVLGEDADGAGWDAVALLSISGGFTERGSVSGV